jgi:RNA polymerase sigma-70 factor (ECF subfamily)
VISKGNFTRSDEYLLHAIGEEKQHSLGELYSRYYSRVYHTCFSYTQNPDDAFDFAQDVMLKVFTSIETFEGKSSFSTWLFAITRNHCLSMLSKKRICYFELSQAGKNLVSEELNTEDLEKRVRDEKLELDLKHYLALLPENDKKMLELKYFHKYSVKDLQREFSLSSSAIKMRLLRARKRIEQMLELSAAA